MDLLREPDTSSIPPKITPYVATETWDGGVFCTYAHRKGMTRIIPPIIRNVPGVPAPEEPYLEGLYPTPPEKLQPFIQTWLYFGLLAEFLSLNEVSPGLRLVEKDVADAEIAALHKECLIEDGDQRYLTGKMVITIEPRIRERFPLAADRHARLSYLGDCLHYADYLRNSLLGKLDHSITYSLAALGEVFATGMMMLNSAMKLKIDLLKFGFSWGQDYMKVGGEVETEMLANGWCPSEIEKIRAKYQGLFTKHYISRLGREGLKVDHSQCSANACVAFQINLATYRPAHASDGCSCSHIVLDESDVASILKTTDSYPVIRVEGHEGDLDQMKMYAETYDPDVPYIALSHVWADGLGNPRESSLPRCQMAKLARLISSIQRQTEATETENPISYRLWVDTLCCPVELSGKMTALQRLADVYRNAKHVLVLDSALTKFSSESTHPAELLMRTFGASPWMRRLWTLQEGSLARSLYVQFADKAVDCKSLMHDLFREGMKNASYMRIWQDVMRDFNELQVLCRKDSSHALKSNDAINLMDLQRALDFRTVTVPSDEPLCIATLMDLDPKYVGSGSDAEQRMVRVWELINRAQGGLPSRIMFYLEQALSAPGWRWAPASLLGSSAGDSIWTFDHRTLRFNDMVFPDGSNYSNKGVPGRLGLKVKLPGCRLEPRALMSGLPLDPWDGFLPNEDEVLVQDRVTGHWMRIIDAYRSNKVATWTKEERQAYDLKTNRPLAQSILTGKCALICDQAVNYEEQTRMCVMVQVEDMEEVDRADGSLGLGAGEQALKARRERNVILSRLNAADERMKNTLQRLAHQIAAEKETLDYVEIDKGDQAAREAGRLALRERMKEAMAEVWASDPDLRQNVEDMVGKNMGEHMWAYLPKSYSCNIYIHAMPDGQTWFVD